LTGDVEKGVTEVSDFQATTIAAGAPNVETGIYDLRFDGFDRKTVKGGKFQKDPINGDPKIEWHFTLLDDDGAALYDGGDPVEVDVLTGVGFNVASKTMPAEVKILKALMSEDEFADFVEGKGVNAADLLGRTVQGEVYIKESGYPGVTNIIAARKRRASRPRSADAE
jgi:hypothetical protein